MKEKESMNLEVTMVEECMAKFWEGKVKGKWLYYKLKKEKENILKKKTHLPKMLYSDYIKPHSLVIFGSAFLLCFHSW